MIRDYGPGGQVTPDTFAAVQIHVGDGFATSWGNARDNFYGVTGTPTAWFDGVLDAEGAYQSNSQMYNWYRSKYLQRRGVATDVTIALTGEQVSGPTYTMEATVCIESGGSAKTMRLYMVQVLDYWPMSFEGGNSYSRNGFKQAASWEDFSLRPGQECAVVQRTFTFDSRSWSSPNDIKVIAWAQRPYSSGPAEVFQAAVAVWPFDLCLNGELDGGEDRIDCGGSCPACECLSDGSCDDFLVCTGDETCDAYGTCQSSGDPCTDPDFPYCDEANQECDECTVASHCDDGNSCTDDACAVGVCVNTNNTDPCDDENACTTGDACSGGACASGLPLDCDDGEPCTDDTCESATGCVYTNNSNACDDGVECTVDDACTGGACGGTYQVRLFGDIMGGFCPPACPQPDLDDITCILDDFANGPAVDGCGANDPPESADLAPCGGDGVLDLDDVLYMLDAFAQIYRCPHACP